jgi:hypothetical protein
MLLFQEAPSKIRRSSRFKWFRYKETEKSPKIGQFFTGNKEFSFQPLAATSRSS